MALAQDQAPGAPGRQQQLGTWMAAVERRLYGAIYEPRNPAKAGGKCVTASLGPKSNIPRRNDAKASLPKAITAARRKYPKCVFKAGHLLNCHPGGNGKDWRNMTILTSSANTKMTKLDNAVMRGVYYLEKIYEQFHAMGIPAATPTLRIWLQVRISRGMWSREEEPDLYIARQVSVQARRRGSTTYAKFGSEAQKHEVDRLVAALDATLKKGCGSVRNLKKV